MIRVAQSSDYPKLRELWAECCDKPVHEHSDERYVHYVMEEEGEFVCVLSTISRLVYVRPYLLKTTLIGKICAKQPYHIPALVDFVLRERQEKEMLTLLRDDDIYRWNLAGFQPCYKRKDYVLNKAFVYPFDHIVHEISEEEYHDLYIRFTSHFNGYFERSVEDIRRYMFETKRRGGEWIAYIKEGEIRGLMTFYEGEEMRIEECLYLDTEAFKQMLAYVTSKHKTTRLSLFEKEVPERFVALPDACLRNETSVRLNKPEQLSILYHKNIKHINDLFDAKLPLFLREDI